MLKDTAHIRSEESGSAASIGSGSVTAGSRESERRLSPAKPPVLAEVIVELHAELGFHSQAFTNVMFSAIGSRP